MAKKFPIVSNVNIGLNTTKDGIEYVNFGTQNASEYQLPKASFTVNSTTITNTAGSASINEVTFAGTYAVGDQIRLTLTIKDSAQTLIKNFVHTVTDIAVASIASAFATLIEASITNGLPGIASASSALGVLSITSSSVTSNNFQVSAYTGSALGTVSPSFSGGSAQTVTQAEGRPAVLQAAGVPAADITLAQYDTVLLTYKADAAIPFIDSEGKIVKEVIAFVPVGQGATLISRF